MTITSTRDDHLTDSVRNARADARAQAGQTSEWMPYLPASSSPFCPDEVDPAQLTWAETVAPGGYTHKVLARGSRLRLDDPTGEACAHVLVFNALEPVERLNVADTQKIPWQAYLGANHPLLSGDGASRCEVVGSWGGGPQAKICFCVLRYNCAGRLRCDLTTGDGPWAVDKRRSRDSLVAPQNSREDVAVVR